MNEASRRSTPLYAPVRACNRVDLVAMPPAHNVEVMIFAQHGRLNDFNGLDCAEDTCEIGACVLNHWLTAQGATCAQRCERDNTRMAVLGLRDAAQQVGLHRSSLFRAIRTGRLSATRTEGGDYEIETSELFRVYPAKSSAQDAHLLTHPRAQGEATGRTSLDVRVATLEAELRGQRELIETLRRECDRWAAQAERLALAPPRAHPQPWWRWRRSGAS